jgi:hypothetical protein
MNNTILPFDPSTDIELSGELINSFSRFEQIARQRISDMLESDAYTELEKAAMIAFEMLKLTNTVEVANNFTRALLLHNIEKFGLWSEHPEKFTDFYEAVKRFGMSKSQASDLLAWFRIVLPYLEENFGMTPAEVLEQYGISSLRSITPVLKSLITGEQSKSKAVNEKVGLVLGNVPEESDDPTRDAVLWTLGIAEGTVSSIRKSLRVEKTDALAVLVFEDDRGKVALMEMTEDQWQLFFRKMEDTIDPIPGYDAKNNPIVRRLLK